MIVNVLLKVVLAFLYYALIYIYIYIYINNIKTRPTRFTCIPNTHGNINLICFFNVVGCGL